MKNNRSFIIALLALVLLAACENEKQEKAETEHHTEKNQSKVDKQALIKEIADLNAQLLADSTGKINRPMAYKLISKYELYVKTFTADAQSPDYAFKAADLAQGLGDGRKAVELYDFILDTYPSYEKYPEALFLKAFVQENILKQLGNAKDTYNKFMLDFPDHELYDDAQASVKYMGKSPEELIKEFEAKNKK